MPLDPVRNFAKVTASAGYAAGVTSITLVSGDGAKLPNPATDGAFNLVWWNFTDYPDPADDPNVEIVRCTARSGDTLTITRGQEGTSDVNHNIAGKTYKLVLSHTKKMKDDIEASLGAGGDWVKLGEAIATGTVISLSVTIPVRKYLMFYCQKVASPSNGGGIYLQFNNDTGTRYSARVYRNGTQQDMAVTSEIELLYVVQAGMTGTVVGWISNYATRAKLVISQAVTNTDNSVSTVPYAEWSYGKWIDTSSPITTITVTSGGVYSFAADSRLVVYGSKD